MSELLVMELICLGWVLHASAVESVREHEAGCFIRGPFLLRSAMGKSTPSLLSYPGGIVIAVPWYLARLRLANQ